MKRVSILLISAVLFSALNSCSPYKNSTTPDDVYYSPGSPVEKTVTNGNNDEYYSTPNDNYVRMKAQDPDKWSYFDDYNTDYYASNFGYGYGGGFGMGVGIGFGMGYNPWYGGFGYYSPMSFYNSYYAWNSFYNPYYGGIIIVNGQNTSSPSYARMSNFNPSAYKGSYYNSRPSTHFYNANASRSQYYQNNGLNRSYNDRPSYNPSSQMMRTNSFGGGSGGGGAMRGGSFSRPGR